VMGEALLAHEDDTGTGTPRSRVLPVRPSAA
jgi:hypothetical protein